MDEIIQSAASAAGISKGWVEVAELTVKAVTGLAKAGMKAEQQRVSLEQVLGKANGAAAYANIKRDATSSPFELDKIYEANKLLVNAGENATNARKDIQNLGVAVMAAGGDSNELIKLTSVLQTVYRNGRASKEQLQEFSNAGVDIYKILSDAAQKPIKANRDLSVSYELLSRALNKAGQGGDAEHVVDTARGTTSGKLTELTNNWEIFKSNVGDFLLPVTNELLDTANAAFKAVDFSKTEPEILQNEQTAIQMLVKSITDLNEGNATRRYMLEDLKNKYPDLFASIDVEKIKNKELATMLSSVNDQYVRRIRLSSVDIQKKELGEEISKDRKDAEGIYMQSAYNRAHPNAGFLDNFKYFSLSDRLKNADMSFFSLLNPMEMQIKGPAMLMGDPDVLKSMGDKHSENADNNVAIRAMLDKAQVVQDLYDKAAIILDDPKIQKHLWGKNTDKNRARLEYLIQDYNRYQKLTNPAQVYRTGASLLNRDNSELSKIVADKSPNVQQPMFSYPGEPGTARDITSGGSNNITININKFFDNLNLTAQNMQQGYADLEGEVEKIFLRIVNSAHTVSDKN